MYRWNVESAFVPFLKSSRCVNFVLSPAMICPPSRSQIRALRNRFLSLKDIRPEPESLFTVGRRRFKKKPSHSASRTTVLFAPVLAIAYRQTKPRGAFCILMFSSAHLPLCLKALYPKPCPGTSPEPLSTLSALAFPPRPPRPRPHHRQSPDASASSSCWPPPSPTSRSPLSACRS